MCNSEKAEPVYLDKEKFQEIKIKLGKELINFDTIKNKWNTFIKNSMQISTNIKKSKNEHNQEDIERLKKENEEKDKKISDLESKINGVKKDDIGMNELSEKDLIGENNDEKAKLKEEDDVEDDI